MLQVLVNTLLAAKNSPRFYLRASNFFSSGACPHTPLDLNAFPPALILATYFYDI